jgi:hypothetical protein
LASVQNLKHKTRQKLLKNKTQVLDFQQKTGVSSSLQLLGYKLAAASVLHVK